MKPEQLKDNVIKAEVYAEGYAKGFKEGYIACANNVALQLEKEDKESKKEEK